MGLRDLVREVLIETPDGSTRDVAALVAKRTPEDVLLNWYTDALVHVVSKVIRDDRNAAMDEVFKGRSTPPPQPKNERRKPTTSPRVDRIRETWAKFIAQEVLVNTERKFLRDCNADDLRHAADYRRAQAGALWAKADEYDALVTALDAYGVELVGQLPPEVMNDLPGRTL